MCHKSNTNYVATEIWRPGGITIVKRVCVPQIQDELRCQWDIQTWWNYIWQESLCATNPTRITLPVRMDFCGQQMAQTARAMTLPASVRNGQITQTATRVLALSSRTPSTCVLFSNTAWCRNNTECCNGDISDRRLREQWWRLLWMLPTK